MYVDVQGRREEERGGREGGREGGGREREGREGGDWRIYQSREIMKGEKERDVGNELDKDGLINWPASHLHTSFISIQAIVSGCVYMYGFKHPLNYHITSRSAASETG